MTTEEIFSFENLYQAYLYTRNGKRDKSSVIRYSLHALENINYTKLLLHDRHYNIGEYYEFTVKYPKERIIRAPPFRDRVVQRCLCAQVLTPVIEKHLIYDTYACRIGKGAHAGLNRTEYFFRNHYQKYGQEGWVVKGDISKYFYSIDHDVLKQNLKPLLKEYDVWWLITKIIDGTEGCGVPLGNQSSQWFANFYLSKFDHFVKEQLHVKHYIRYMDDWVAIVRTKEEAKQILDAMIKFLDVELHLKTNKKTQILPLKNGVDFLGFHMYLTESGKVVRKIRTSSKKAMKRKLKSFKKKYKEGLISEEEIERSYTSWKGHARHGNCYGLIREMDILYNDIFTEGDIQYDPTNW